MNKWQGKDLFVGINCLLFFALFLVFRKSYSIITVFLLVFSLYNFRSLLYFWKDTSVKCLSVYFFSIAIIWSHSFDSIFSWSSEGDYFLRYTIGAICMIVLALTGVKKEYLISGLAIGAIGAAVYGIIQYPVLGRAEGYTNAIRFGNIALLMAVFLMVFSFSMNYRIYQKLLIALGAIGGLIASFLSLSRGGWIFIAFLPFLFILFYDCWNERLKKFTLFVLMGVSSIFVAYQFDLVKKRVEIAQVELHGYFHEHENYVHTSVGARLEQWKMAWEMGKQKPIFGWGDRGVDEGRKMMVEQGHIHKSALQIPHAHNEYLEMWATRGIVGVLFLTFIYLVPAWIFFPTKRKINVFPEEKRRAAQGLYIAGLSIPCAYFVFGLTDVFFNLSLGHVFMIFSMVFIMAAIQDLKNND